MKFFLVLLIPFVFLHAEIDRLAFHKYEKTKLFKQQQAKATTHIFINQYTSDRPDKFIMNWGLTFKSINEQTGKWASLGATAKSLHSDYLYTIISLLFIDSNGKKVFSSKKIRRKIFLDKRNIISISTPYPKNLKFQSMTMMFEYEFNEPAYSKFTRREKKKKLVKHREIEKEKKLAKQRQIEKKKLARQLKIKNVNKIKEKINQYCKIKASVFKYDSLQKHELKRCTKEILNKNLSLNEIERMINYENSDEAKNIILKRKKRWQIAEEKAHQQKIKKKKIMSLPTGIWRIAYYRDRFGEKTTSAYITTSALIRGTFSNTATENSKLNVFIMIDSSTKISMKLYEYAGNNPIKESYHNAYNIYILDRNKKVVSFRGYSIYARKGYYDVTPRANLKTDRLVFDSDSVKAVNAALEKGGRLIFNIENADDKTTQYDFIIENADYYKNALKQLDFYK